MSRCIPFARATCALLCSVLWGLLAAEAAGPIAQTRFDALVAAMAGDSPAARQLFADAALAQLIAANAAEVRRSSDEPARAGGWRRGTLSFITHLQLVRQQLPQVASVEIVREAHGTVRLIIGDDQVMLSAPRVSEQPAFEARVADQVCTQRDCVAAGTTIDEVVVAREQRMTGEWALADSAPPMYSQADGLHCVFENVRHLRLKQAACEAVTRELRLLEESLRAVLQHGGPLDWAALKVERGREGGRGGRSRVSYGASGRYFELDLPHLAAEPSVVQGAIPWLQTRLRGQRATYVITTPERLAYRVSDTD